MLGWCRVYVCDSYFVSLKKKVGKFESPSTCKGYHKVLEEVFTPKYLGKKYVIEITHRHNVIVSL